MLIYIKQLQLSKIEAPIWKREREKKERKVSSYQVGDDVYYGTETTCMSRKYPHKLDQNIC